MGETEVNRSQLFDEYVREYGLLTSALRRGLITEREHQETTTALFRIYWHHNRSLR